MKNQNIVLIAIASALAFALAPVTQAAPTPQDYGPTITIQNAGNVLRGKTGSFVLKAIRPPPPLFFGGGVYVNFSVSGTAIPGADYVALVSPAYIGQSGYGVISVATLPDPRGPFDRQAYSVVVTLEPGAGYVVGEPASAQMWIKPTR